MKINNVKIGVVGLGYVGIPLAMMFDSKYEVIGFDLDSNKIDMYKNGIDVTREVGDEKIRRSEIKFTDNEKELSICDVLIVAVPTPVDDNKNPDLQPVIGASQTIGRNMKKGAIVIYESTVYPGLTEEICKPVLEENSNMKCGEEFKIAYSPERVNPGDKIHRVENITKIVSGMDDETLEKVAKLYESVLENGVYRASSIKVAEAAKVIENSQRDVNIAFANEVAIMCNKLGIDTNDVLDAASSKWNFLNFRPGLVGGHCIGVDPYYLIKKSEELGYKPRILTSARDVNESISGFIVQNIIDKLISKGIKPEEAKVQILGVTFKENVNDTRNSKVIDIIKQLKEAKVQVFARDCYVSKEEIEKHYNIEIDENKDNELVDILVVAVAHDEYRKLSATQLNEMLNSTKILFDIKNIYKPEILEKEGIEYWRL